VPAPSPIWTQAALRAAHWLLLGGWLGSWSVFALTVAPTAFRVLPSPEIAGSLVSPVLAALHLYGAAAGLGLALLARPLGRGAALIVAPLLLSALCLFSHFGVSAQIAALGDVAFGPEGSTELAERFGRLHRLSMGIFGAVLLSTLGLVSAHAWSDANTLSNRGEIPSNDLKSGNGGKNA